MKSQSVIHSIVLFFFPKVAVVIQSLLWFDINARIFCSNSVKNIVGILIGICIDLWGCCMHHGLFNSVNSSNPWIQSNLPFLCVFFSLFVECLKSILGQQFLYFNISRMSFHSLLAYRVSERAADSLMEVYLEVTILFSLAAFKIFRHWPLTVLSWRTLSQLELAILLTFALS